MMQNEQSSVALCDGIAMPAETGGQHEAAVREIRKYWQGSPRVGIILGTGMGNLARCIQAEAEIPFQDIPHFPLSTAIGHKGQLVCGKLDDVPVVAMEGRCHLYEGYTVQQITLPIRAMADLGIQRLIVGNASGGVNPKFAVGDVMVIHSHINLMRVGFAGLLPVGLGGRCARNALSLYDQEMGLRALEIARQENFVAHPGVYVAVTGPNYETRAEYRFFRRIGGDAIGMSTIPEVTIAAQLGMRVLALSTITNVARPDAIQRVDGHQVIAAGQDVEPNLRKIVCGVIRTAGEDVRRDALPDSSAP